MVQVDDASINIIDWEIPNPTAKSYDNVKAGIEKRFFGNSQSICHKWGGREKPYI